MNHLSQITNKYPDAVDSLTIQPTMHKLRFSFLLLILFNSAVSLTSTGTDLQADQAATREEAKIDPRGIRGSLILAGTPMPVDTFKQFMRRAGKQVVLVQFGSEPDTIEAVQRFLANWQDSESAQLTIVDLNNDASQDALATDAISKASAVWLAGNDSTVISTNRDLGKAIASVIQRNGIVGCAGSLATFVGSRALSKPGLQDSQVEQRSTLQLLPDSVITATSLESETIDLVKQTTKQEPNLVGYAIGANAAVIVQGRRLQTMGTGKVQVYLAASHDSGNDSIELSKQQIGDLTALRRAVRDPFPAKQPQPPIVKNGTLIAIGGDGMPAGIIDRFVELAGGKESSIIVLPTAMPDPIRKQNGMANKFRKAGAGQVTVLPQRSLAEVESAESLNAFREATGIWFGGGRQWRFVDAYQDTKVEPLMHDVLKRGGVIMGSSAGASIQAEYLARGNPLGNTDVMAAGYERGLGFLPGVAIDQHFTSRKRFPDMTKLVARYPQLLGIGIDGGTAIIVQGNRAEVVGKGSVHFYDSRKVPTPGNVDYESVKAGGAYNLESRQPE
ncbi:MAG: cyanophycinase [Planctomycetaceae bacterium]|nr:cyanophycinase [Planctomycetaceae bacterium]